MNDFLHSGDVLGDRYRILKILGRSGLENTYLAEDLRVHERRVIKQVALTLQSQSRQAEELLKQQAENLYKLQHPQVPTFRQLLQVNRDNTKHWCLVRDYVEGQTYRQILTTRQQQGVGFSELEAVVLLNQVLPILEYLHARGVAHLNICADSLLWRSYDGLPVLINCGSLEQVAASCQEKQNASELKQERRDLSALAATVIELLTGKEFAQSSQALANNGLPAIALSPALTKILKHMTKQKAGYATAAEVQKVLCKNFPQLSYSQTPKTASVAIPSQSQISDEASKSLPLKSKLVGCLSKTVLVTTVIVSSGVAGWIAGKIWIERMQQQSSVSPKIDLTRPPTQSEQNETTTRSKPLFSDLEERRQASLRRRRRQLGIEAEFFEELVNEAFWQRYPTQQGKSRGDYRPSDGVWRQRWNEIADEYLERLSLLSPQALENLGSYDRQQRDRWKRAVNSLHLSSRALYDLADGKFFALFPGIKDQRLTQRPIGQVWSAIVYDQLQDLRSGTALEQIFFSDGVSSADLEGTLKPGEGKAYIIYLQPPGNMTISLEADREILLSVYSPTGKVKILADSQARQWSGSLPETGFYELVLVSQAQNPVEYELTLQVENSASELVSGFSSIITKNFAYR